MGWLVAGAGVTGAGVGVETSALSATSPFSKADKFCRNGSKGIGIMKSGKGVSVSFALAKDRYNRTY